MSISSISVVSIRAPHALPGCGAIVLSSVNHRAPEPGAAGYGHGATRVHGLRGAASEALGLRRGCTELPSRDTPGKVSIERGRGVIADAGNGVAAKVPASTGALIIGTGATEL